MTSDLDIYLNDHGTVRVSMLVVVNNPRKFGASSLKGSYLISKDKVWGQTHTQMRTQANKHTKNYMTPNI